MQFSPKKYEKIIACARNSLQKRIYRSDINHNYKKHLKTITKLSLLTSETQLQIFDIEYILRIFLAACYVAILRKNSVFRFSIHGAAFGYTDKNLLFIILLEIITHTKGKMTIKIESGNIKITADNSNISGYLKKLFKRKNITYLKANDKIGVLLPFTSADKQSTNQPDIIELMQNPLSPINLWL